MLTRHATRHHRRFFRFSPGMSTQPSAFENRPLAPALSNEARRDRALREEIEDLLRHDCRTHGAHVTVQVRGGVAHLRNANDALPKHLVRRLITRLRGINGVWDTDPGLRVVDIGCGGNKQQAHALGVDRHPHAGVDVVTDLERGLPFATSSVDRVFAVHFLEHVRGLIELMNEIHRVLKPDGVLHVIVPHCDFVNAIADPTHVRFFHAQTFKFFCRPYPGARLFRPLAIASTHDNVFADLQPLPEGEAPLSDDELARFFD